ncbi:expansin family protein [Lactarius indigo]|nr:expansin family protein [Lactarius indigo]
MRFISTLFLSVVALMTPALAAPHAAVRVEIDTRDAAADFLVGTHVGQGTWYNPGLGSCGITNTDSDYIAAVSHILYDGYPGYSVVNPNSNPVCGRKIAATYKGKSVTITATDRCEACAETDLDFSPAAFSQLADISVGRLGGVSWHWA